MKLHPDLRHSRQLVVTACDSQQICVNGRPLFRSFLLTPEHLDEQWGPDRFAALTTAHLAALLPLPGDVLLLGTGVRQHFPAPATLRPLIDARIGFEIMDTAAACRTYNILVAEGRAVCAALILEKPLPA